MIIYSNLRVKMAERGLTIKDINKKTDLSRTTISNLYNGYSDGIKFHTLEKLCDFLNCTPNDLLKILEIKVNDITFNPIPLNNPYLIYYFNVSATVKIEETTKTVQSKLTMHMTEDEEMSGFFHAEIFIEDDEVHFIEDADLNFSKEVIKRINAYIERKIIAEFIEDDDFKQLIAHYDVSYFWG